MAGPQQKSGAGFRDFLTPKRSGWLCILTVFALQLSSSAIPQEKEGKPAFRIPPGVDSALAVEAWRTAALSLVAAENEIEAARLKAWSAGRFRTARQIQGLLDENPGELEGVEIPQEIRELVGGRVREGEWRRVLVRESRALLESIRDSLETAWGLDPLDAGLGADLAWVYSFLDEPEAQEKAVVLLQRSLEIDRGNPEIFNRLADVYVLLDDWSRAAEQYKNAYETLRGFEFLTGAGADTAVSFEILMALGNAYIQSFNSPQAERTFQDAMRFARGADESSLVRESIALIRWADGDILARQMFAEADRLTREGKNWEAAERYHSVLKRTRGRADGAFWEASYLLGLLEYNHLQAAAQAAAQAADFGLNRLMLIAEEALTRPDDLSLGRYRDSYGILLFNEAMKRVKEGDLTNAMPYLEQGALTQSPAQGRSALELVKLTHGVPRLGFLWGLHALRFSDLQAEEQRELWVLLRSIARRLNLPSLSRYFHEGLLNGRLSPESDPENRFVLLETLRCGTHFLHLMLSPLRGEALTLENRYKEMAREALVLVDPTRRPVLMETLQNTFRAIDESWMQNSRQVYRGE